MRPVHPVRPVRLTHRKRNKFFADVSIGWHWFAYSIRSIVADFTLRADIFESAGGSMVETCE